MPQHAKHYILANTVFQQTVNLRMSGHAKNSSSCVIQGLQNLSEKNTVEIIFEANSHNSQTISVMISKNFFIKK